MVTSPPSEKIRFAVGLSSNFLGIRHHVISVGRAYINEGREAHRKGVQNLFVSREFIRRNWQSVNRYREVIKANIHLLDVPRRVIRNTQSIFFG
jgi:hypothetical protein